MRVGAHSQTGAGPGGAPSAGSRWPYLVKGRSWLEHELPHRRRDVRTVRVRRLVLLQRLVDVASEEDPVAHLVDGLNGPVAVLVVDPLPLIWARVRWLARDRGVRDPRGVVDPLEVDQ